MNPLYILYRRGPGLNGFGFWYGKTNEEICSFLTNSEPKIWERNQLDCNNIIERHYDAFAIMVYAMLCLLCLYKSFSSCITYITIIRPIQKSIYAYKVDHSYNHSLDELSKCE